MSLLATQIDTDTETHLQVIKDEKELNKVNTECRVGVP